MPHGVTTVQNKNKRHILQQHMRHVVAREQPENFVHQPGVFPLDSSRSARLRQILTRKSPRQEFRAPRDFHEISHIAVQRHIREMFCQNRTRTLINLTMQQGLVPGPAQAEFDTTNPCEKPRNFHYT